MYKIQANEKGSREISVSEEHLKTIEQYQLFRNLLDSSGVVDETILEKLRYTVRSLLVASADTNKPLLDFCLDVLYHSNMKAFGLHQLLLLYIKWSERENQENGTDK